MRRKHMLAFTDKNKLQIFWKKSFCLENQGLYTFYYVILMKWYNTDSLLYKIELNKIWEN